VPFTVRVKAAPPALALVGDKELIVGVGFPIEKLRAPEVPPPGLGLVTVMLAVPALAISEPGTCAVSCVALAKVVVSAAPFQLTTEPFTKLLPVTVSVKAVPPTTALFGESDERMGALLFIANVTALEVPPPGVGLVTVILAVPALAMSLAGTCAVSCVALTNVVVSEAPPHLTTELEMKFAPLTVRVKAAPPTVAPVGDTEAIVGAGLFIASDTPAEVPPPGAGFVTVRVADPAAAMLLAGTCAVSCVPLM
jgi:hypothetical protein